MEYIPTTIDIILFLIALAVFIDLYRTLKEVKKWIGIIKESSETNSQSLQQLARNIGIETKRLKKDVDFYKSNFDRASKRVSGLTELIKISQLPRFEHLGNNECMYEMPDGREMHMTKIPHPELDRVMYKISLKGRGDVLLTIDEMHAIDHLARYTMNGIDIVSELQKEHSITTNK